MDGNCPYVTIKWTLSMPGRNVATPLKTSFPGWISCLLAILQKKVAYAVPDR